MSERPLDKFLSKKSAGAEPATGDAEETNYRAYGIDRTGRPVLMLDVRGADGHRLALSFAYLMSAEFDAAGEMVLSFTDHRVTVRGRNLRRVYDAVLTHTLRFLQEEAQDANREDETFISEIMVEQN
ncbi:MAG TPA: hypothetical protein VF666_11210 [Pyrinomonadaceae bacterium]|jgi:hypothetical protein